MPSYKTAFGSHLKTEDLQGRKVRAIVEHCEMVTIKGQDGAPDERKLAAHFTGKDKTLILNRTRCEQLERIFGTDDYEQWAGPVVLAPGTTKFGGKTVGCIDIEAPNRPAPPPVEDEPLDSEPF